MRDLLIGTDAGVDGLPEAKGPVLCLAHADGILAAVTEGGRAVLVGETVHRVPDHKATCVAMGSTGVLVGTAEAHLLRLDQGRLTEMLSFDDAPGREKWYTPWGGPPDVRSIATADQVYVNVHVGGILASGDGGETWRPTIDIDSDVHQVIVDRERLLAATAAGLAVSEDSGATWRYETEGLHAPYCRAVAVAGDRVLLSASEGPHAGRCAVYASGGGRFERCTDFFKGNIDTFCLVAEGEDCAFGTETGEVFVSADGGATWQQTYRGPGSIRCLLTTGGGE